MKNRLRYQYIISDIIMSYIGIITFYLIRYYSSPHDVDTRTLETWLLHDTAIVSGLIFFPIMMMMVYAISGYYNNPLSPGRLKDMRNSFLCGLFGMLIIFFIILINDYLPQRSSNYLLLFWLWICLSFPVFIGRSIVSWLFRKRIKKLDGIFTTVIIGAPSRTKTLRKKITGAPKNNVSGFRVIDEISAEENSFKDIIQKVEHYNPDYIIITLLPEGLQATTELISALFPLNKSILITPDLHQVLTSRTRLSNVVGEPLINISHPPLSPLTTNLKRISDIAVSFLSLIILSPIFAAIAVAIKIDSKGTVFYKQERIGLNKRPFQIIKFRTMFPEAESNGPALSSEDDARITNIGRFLRKYRIDELPQFWNVIRGDMSLVGPRPERKFYVDRIVKRVPHYSLIHKVRPGITSWGMVKYGYASNVDEMIDRLYYDLLYIENVSFSIDMKIIFHTVITVLKGKGM